MTPWHLPKTSRVASVPDVENQGAALERCDEAKACWRRSYRSLLSSLAEKADMRAEGDRRGEPIGSCLAT